MKPKLVLFDMDGTLIDTESIAEQVMAKVITDHLGFEMKPDEVRDRYIGREFQYQLDDLTSRYGGPLPDTFMQAVSREWTAATQHLPATDGAEAVIEALIADGCKVCVVSNSGLNEIRRAMDISGLARYFNGAYFSGADQVDNPKPAPDVYLLAAQTFGVDPKDCLVIEDSEVGVRGALAAGMRVVGTAAAHPAA